MSKRRIMMWLALLAAISASRASAQFIPRETMIPAEIAAQGIAPDRAAPTADQINQIRKLEFEARLDQPCNTAFQAALEAPRRALLRLYEDTYGPEHPATARPLLSMLCHFTYHDNTSAERAHIIDRLVTIGRSKAQPVTLFAGLTARSEFQMERFPMAREELGRAIEDATEALSLARRMFTDKPVIVARTAGMLAKTLEIAGRTTDAEPHFQEQVNLLQSAKERDRFPLANAYQGLANNLVKQFRIVDAQVWFSRAIDIFELEVPEADSSRLVDITTWAQTLFLTNPERVDALYRAILVRQESDPASTDKRNWMTLWNLAKSARSRRDADTAISYQRRVIGAIGPGPANSFELELAAMLSDRRETAAEAEGIYLRALSRDPNNPELIERYGTTLWMLDRFDEALPLRKRGIEIAIARYGRTHRETLRLVQNLGVALWLVKRPAEARPFYEDVLSGYRAELSSLPEGSNAEYRRNLSGFISSKASDLLKLYWTDRANAKMGSDAVVRAKGFAVAQLVYPSVSSAAISETAARSLAMRKGKGDLFARWATFRDRVIQLDQAIGEAAQRGADGDANRVQLLNERAAASQTLMETATALHRELPDVFVALRPEPVPLADLTGNDHKPGLLRDDEALVLLYPGVADARGEMSRGIIFAATRGGSAWAEIPVDGADLAALVRELDSQLANSSHSGVTAREPGEDPAAFLRYDRTAAYRVYRAFFGDPSVAALLKDKTRWIVVPEGPLLSLNFAALVSAPPEGGAYGDIDPVTLRATKWLGLEKVIAILPSVDALRTGRRSSRGDWVANTFFGVGDPAFRGIADPAPKPVPPRPQFGLSSVPPVTGGTSLARERLYRDGITNPATLSDLARLDYSATEVQKIAMLLAAPSDRLALQLEATQARVERSSLDGTLADSSIVLFATHALLGGELDGMLAEPALALTPGTGSANQLGEANDGLLTASEVAQLRFNAALVILSACDTAAGAGDGDGFSGLTRAFLLAGARAVLATYSPVVDEVGERMTTTTVANLKGKSDAAEALQEAMREVFADPSLDEQGESLAHPAAWAVYVAIDPS